ncbi:CHAD domain-containing protein [Solicola gregarius]|uniref:CHAD domain-containing protein n=1 Tax=Solicola gregarius TaxID=2908642 RepID=A0AA46TKI7_9ACTN|nr:CHAD domain-containing protein [Solicola gregarius]UYM07014.1 CHAD domain-containing protein [Solicola gregarius]
MGPSRGDDPWRAVEEYAHAQLRVITELADSVRDDEPDAVHRLRVACRRLRATSHTFRTYVDVGAADRLARELRWFAGRLAPARDAEVTGVRLRASLASLPPGLVIGPVADRIGETFAAQARSAHGRAIAALDHPRYAALPALVGEIGWPARAGGVGGDAVRGCAYQAVRRVDRRLAAASVAPPGGARTTALHDARKAGKRARYAAEAIRDLGGDDAGRLVESLERLQDVLGTYNDAVNAQRALDDLLSSAESASESGFTYGLLYAHEQAAADDALAVLPAAERDFEREPLRCWLVP